MAQNEAKGAKAYLHIRSTLRDEDLWEPLPNVSGRRGWRSQDWRRALRLQLLARQSAVAPDLALGSAPLVRCL